MSIRQIRKLLEKLDDALDDVEIGIEATNEELDAANVERDDYAFQLEEAREELARMEEEMKLLCQLLIDARVSLPLSNHFIDINPYLPKADLNKGKYEVG